MKRDLLQQSVYLFGSSWVMPVLCSWEPWGQNLKSTWFGGNSWFVLRRSTGEGTGQKSENQKNIFRRPSCYSRIRFPGEDLDALVSVSYDGNLHMF